MNSTSNLFEYATREQLRFSSNRGMLSVEDLWELPLTSRDGCNLDSVAKATNNALKAMAEESFVETRSNPAKAIEERKLEIVKHIIAVKLEENATKRTAAARKEQKDKLLNILAEKQEGKLRELSVEEIQAQIAALGE